MIVFHDEAITKEMAPGITRRLLSHDKNLMVCEFTFRKGAVVEMHTHPHEQVTYVVSGAFEGTLDGKTVTLKPGDSVYAAPNVPHRMVALEDTVSIDAFTPQREDYL